MKPSEGLPILGLTGLIGSGKTTVRGMLEARGAFCLNADTLAHQVMKRGRHAYEPVVAVFGEGILGEDGEIDRKKLGALAFGTPAMEMLNRIIHPEVARDMKERLNAACAAGRFAFAVIDAPLLIEAGLHTWCKQVWWVTAPEELRKARIIERDKLTEAEAEARMITRAREDELLPHAQVVIRNNGDRAALEAEVEKALQGWVYA